MLRALLFISLALFELSSLVQFSGTSLGLGSSSCLSLKILAEILGLFYFLVDLIINLFLFLTQRGLSCLDIISSRLKLLLLCNKFLKIFSFLLLF